VAPSGLENNLVLGENHASLRNPWAARASILLGVAWVAAGYWIHAAAGREAAFAWIVGGIFGFTLQRSRFCFFCNFRDFFEKRNTEGVLAILIALAVGLVGYHVITNAWIIDPSAGHLPPKAHVAPIGWHLALGGLLFGAGMGLSGSCISAHFYRLGEGTLAGLLALAGVVLGIVIALLFWNPVYLNWIHGKPAIWLPVSLGFAGSLFLQLAVIAGLAFWVWQRGRPGELAGSTPRSWSTVAQALGRQRWPAWAGGIAVGLIGVAVLLRLEPLGVTSELSRLARHLGNAAGWLPERLEGLDAIRGCAAHAADGFWSNGLIFLIALVLTALAGALFAGEFVWEVPRFRGAVLALVGGVLLGAGSTYAAGCTIGTFLSGIHASALSGWAFGFPTLIGALLAWPLRKRWLGL